MTVPQFSGKIPIETIRQCVGTDSPTMLEIGCNDGADTAKFLAAFPGISLYCFEPDPRPIVEFIQRIDLTDLRVTLIQAAIGDYYGTVKMYRSSGKPPNEPEHNGDYHMSGSIFKPTGHLAMSPWVKFPEGHRLEVNLWTLDLWLSARPYIDVIDFIWADTQGAEAAMIRGGRETFPEKVRWLYTEYYQTPMYEGQPNLDEICKLLPDFDLHHLYGTDNALFRNRNL